MIFSQDRAQRAITEAALSSSLVHPNVVATYHHSIKPVRAVAPPGGKGAVEIEEVEGGDWKLYLIQVGDWKLYLIQVGGPIREVGRVGQ